MDKVSREKFHEIKSGDRVHYIDPNGCTCQADVVGWKNLAGDPAPIVGQQGDRAIPLSQIISRRRGNDTKEWIKPV